MTTTGKLRVNPRQVMPLPKRGRVKVYLVSCAQNNTDLHAELWANIHALAEHDGAEILVSRLTYAVESRASKGQKVTAVKTAKESGDPVEWWAPKIEPYTNDSSVQLAPGLVWCGELNILPTAANPISGLESYTGRDSSIIPHTKFAMQSIASPKDAGCKLIYTTGTVTQRNYIAKKAGQKAEFHHGYGCLIVEVCHDGTWFVRQINADSEGDFYDLDRKVSRGKVSHGHRPEALAWGDIHARQLPPDISAIGWGRDGILDTLRPRRQILHDLLDFRSANHHDRDDPWKTFIKHDAGATDVAGEVAEAGEFLRLATRSWCETVVVRSNHDEALVRWLKEADFREDPENALFYLRTSTAAYEAMAEGKDFDLIEHVLREAGAPRKTIFLKRDEQYVVCEDAGGGIELGMHGDIGVNGSRGSLRQFARTGRKCVVGHSHSAGIVEGAYQVGVMGALDQGYNTGQSSWSHSNVVVYPNGKRAVITIWKGRWRGWL
jgi:hypothetical protein